MIPTEISKKNPNERAGDNFMSARTERVAKTIKEELAWMVERGEVKDPRIGFVTFTEVDVSADLKHAKVFFSALGPSQVSEAKEGLRSASGFIRAELGKRLHLKYAPQLVFEYDRSVEAGAKIAGIIHRLHEKEKDE